MKKEKPMKIKRKQREKVSEQIKCEKKRYRNKWIEKKKGSD